MKPVRLLSILLILPLVGCQLWTTTAPPQPEPVVPPTPSRDVLAEIRSQAAALVSTVEIQPVENPAIAVLLSGARVDQNAGDSSTARRQIELALQMEPDNPRVLQELAEWHLEQNELDRAAELAQRSFERSSQLGELCARSWLTLAEVSLARAEDAQPARDQALACGIKPLPRL